MTHRPGWSLALVLLAAGAVRAEERRLDARALFAQSQVQNLALDADGKTLGLERGELVEDDGPAAGYSYKPNEEKLSATVWVMKELLVADPAASKATLLVAPGGDLRARVNGKDVELKLEGKAGGYWQAYALPPSCLKAGKNQIVLHGSGKVWIARDDEFALGSRTVTRHPNRSARSGDGGKTWDHDRLGPDGTIDGEYCVRLYLDRHRPRGSLTTPVLDAGNLGGAVLAAPLASVGAVRVRLDAETGKAGRVTLRVRSGPTPHPGASGWSDWQTPDGDGTLARPAGRYLQVAVEMTTSDLLYTPVLKALTVEATPKRGDDWTAPLKVVESHNEAVVRSSIPFEYEPFDHPALRELRTTHKLDEVVKGARDEFDLITRLAVWSSGRWNKGHLREGYPAWDARAILEPHRDGTPVGGFCQQYNLVFLQACASFGIPGRAVSIGPGDHGVAIRGGHEVVEVWSNDFRKWVYVDGDAAWHFVDPASKTPLSLRELRQRQHRKLKGGKGEGVELVKLADSRYAWKGLDAWPPFAELRLIPRSNFLEKKAPLPLNQGMRGWFWTGHHAWTDADAPASLLYGRRVSRPGDWDWTLNQAHFRLEAMDRANEVRVHLDTETPGFQTFVAAIDGRPGRPVTSGFVWKLHPGKNSLEVRPRNVLGREGIPSRVTLSSRTRE